MTTLDTRHTILERIEMEFSESLYRSAPSQMSQECGLDFKRVHGVSIGIASRLDVLMFNFVQGLGVFEPATEPDVDALLACLDAAQSPRFFVALCPDAQPPGIAERLLARGLTHHNSWAKLWRGTSAPPPVSTRLHVDEIGAPRRETFGAILIQGARLPEAAQPWIASTVGQPGWRHYLAFDGVTPVACAALFVNGETGYLGMAATLESHRGQGAQHALIARRIRDAAAMGCRLLVAETAEDTPEKPAPSFRNLKSLGFQLAYLRPNYLWARK